MALVAVNLLIGDGADRQVAKKMTTPKGPGQWIEAKPGAAFAISLQSLIPDYLHLRVLLDGREVKRFYLRGYRESVIDHVVVGLTADKEVRRPLLFGDPGMVHKHAAGPEAEGVVPASNVSCVRVEVRRARSTGHRKLSTHVPTVTDLPSAAVREGDAKCGLKGSFLTTAILGEKQYVPLVPATPHMSKSYERVGGVVEAVEINYASRAALLFLGVKDSELSVLPRQVMTGFIDLTRGYDSDDDDVVLVSEPAPAKKVKREAGEERG